MFISPVEHTFKHGWTPRVVLLVITVGALAIAISNYIDTKVPDEFLIGFAIFMVILTGATWYFVGRAQADLYSEGIILQPALGQMKEIAWNDVVETRFAQQNINTASHFGLIGLLVAMLSKGSDSTQKNLSLQIISQDGKKLKLTSSFKDVEDAIRIVFERVNPRLYAKAVKDLQSTGKVQFGDITVTNEGVVWKTKDQVPYAKIKKFSIDGSQLRLKSEGKWLDAITVKPEKVPNVFVLIDLVENQRAGGKTGKDPVAIAMGNAFQGTSFQS